MKKFQAILEEVMDISRIPMALYNTDGSRAASSMNVNESLSDNVQQFINSDADSQLLGTYYYFKIICQDTLSFVLLVSNFTPDAFTVGRLTVCQLKNLLEAQEDSITKSVFIRSVINGTLTPAEMNRQIKKLKLSAATWAAFIIECEEGYADSYAYQMLDRAFAGHKLDFCCDLDDNRILLIKDISNILKEFPDTSIKLKNTRKKKSLGPADSIQLASSLKLFAQTLVDTLRAEAMIETHIGYSTTTDSFLTLPKIYQEAGTALKIRHTFFAERDTAAYDKLGIGRLIAQLPVELCNVFLYEVFGTHIPDDLDDETQNTIQKFYENNLNISETARQLYLHRNTLVYRLERLEKTIGLDIRKFEDAMTFKLAMMVLAHARE